MLHYITGAGCGSGPAQGGRGGGRDRKVGPTEAAGLGRGDDRVANPHRAQIAQFELFELFGLVKLDKQLYIEQFELTVSQSAVLSTPPQDNGEASKDLLIPGSWKWRSCGHGKMHVCGSII